MKVKSLRTKGLLSNYFEERRKKNREKKVAFFIFMVLFARFMYLSFQERQGRIELLRNILSNNQRNANQQYTNNLNLVD